MSAGAARHPVPFRHDRAESDHVAATRRQYPRDRAESATSDDGWTAVCRLSDIDRETGVQALVEGRTVAVFRTHDDAVHALSGYDPVGRAAVLARGIIGTRTVEGEEVPFVASPLHKQAYDLRTGVCLDDAALSVPTYHVEVRAGAVLVGGLVRGAPEQGPGGP